MRKINITEAYKKATKGPLNIIKRETVNGDAFSMGNTNGHVSYILDDVLGEEAGPTAAVLTHAFNVLPEVVEALEKIANATRIDAENSTNLSWSGMKLLARKALDKVSTVEVPE